MKLLPFIVPEQWVGRNIHGNGDNFKAEGQKVRITWQCTGSMSDWSALKIWKSYHVVSEYWPRQDLELFIFKVKNTVHWMQEPLVWHVEPDKMRSKVNI